ncbi:ATP-binding protein [Streptomyces sp. NPDC002825]|uniref:ATP-binding protein n=1 Tax=Streptomyces sp. NPDC002825 TaxID=3154666 RepID=UPI00331BD5C8
MPNREHVHVDRAEQLARSAAVVDRSDEQQALFFEGPEGIGKTSLLREIYRRHAATGVYYVDLERVVEKDDVLRDLARQARRQDVPLPGYQAVRSQLAQSATVNVHDMRARNSTIQMVVNTSRDHRIQLEAKTDALLDTLAGDARSPVVCLDGFEHCEAPMRGWLGTELLPELLSRRGTSVFVAGRHVPSLAYPHVTAVRTLALPPFGVDAVEEWITTLGFDSLKGQAAKIHRSHDGVPGLIREFLDLHIEPLGTG